MHDLLELYVFFISYLTFFCFFFFFLNDTPPPEIYPLPLPAPLPIKAGDPVGVDPAHDELAFFPLIYWPVVLGAPKPPQDALNRIDAYMKQGGTVVFDTRSEEHTSELQSQSNIVCRLLLEKKKKNKQISAPCLQLGSASSQPTTICSAASSRCRTRSAHPNGTRLHSNHLYISLSRVK